MDIIFGGYGKMTKPHRKPVYYGEVRVIGEAGARPHRLAKRCETANEALLYAQNYVAAVHDEFKNIEDVVCEDCGDLKEKFILDKWRCINCIDNPLGEPVIDLMKEASDE